MARVFLLQDYLRGSTSPALPSPPPLSSPLPASPSPPLLTSLSSHLLSSPPLPSASLSPLLNSLSALVSLASPPFPSNLSLVLGSISLHSSSDSSYHFDLLSTLFHNHISVIASNSEFLPEALAGLGYALSRVDNQNSPYFTRFISFLFTIWQYGEISSVQNGIMVFKLVDWLVSGFIASNSVEKIKTFATEITDSNKWVQNKYSDFAVLMANCGALRALKVAYSRYKFQFDPKIQILMENSIRFFAKKAVLDNNDKNSSLLINCVSIGLAKCGQIGFDPNVVKCISETLLNGIFPLKPLIETSIENPNENFIITKLKDHMNGDLFKEAGAITGIVCNQYSISDEKTKEFVETLIWDYSKELYAQLRRAILAHKNKRTNLLNELEKITEAAFLMYLRRIRLQEYTDSVRRAILIIQENLGLCAQFVNSMPCYDELTQKLDYSQDLNGEKYDWSKDDVQTSRVLFYLRVVPTCISLIPVSLFEQKVVPTMFLYMHHPNEKVTRASHSVLVSFISSFNENGKDENERLDLKERLSFYYVQRALEGYPRVTPFDGVASGVAALVRNLPAGSPATFYCTHSLVRKAKSLTDGAIKTNSNLWKSWDESSEPCKKIVDLLLRLISLVDIQVLPYLLREMAGFISELPTDGQDALLSDMYGHVAESDDVTRKPVLISWLQSLSYLSSQMAKNSVQISSSL
ncbi:hypothetical protein LUZ60_001016 [Juncus effusus]|nr:hypothetical protein LUZ60_001016 [Juncus effusus]